MQHKAIKVRLMGMTIKGNLATSSPNHLKKRSKLPKMAFCTFWQQTEHWLFCCAPMTLTVKVLSYESRPFWALSVLKALLRRFESQVVLSKTMNKKSCTFVINYGNLHFRPSDDKLQVKPLKAF